ncbi:disulfide bond formation protein DsbA [Microvirga tunisiensis]|uniref:Disulfide bond formation protein DsbA n=2 Tax=Pannonibacter tanglangensis TaxID=2750084 RepID=A0A7X5F158_9HYPH|nr:MULTISPECIES: DsbA family oxidoreductase [unclassified Pannonibacter]NBN62189.1 disulfide bond formation protein DsbA [Pannonibacter sp. XCT-34]NBN77857.1 disulfide bond formation protein DsbA [Pannonibacter sp. XCT-53]
MSSQKPLVVDVISDVMCPWCYIGKRRLEKAIRSVPDIAVDVRWHPYQLDPTLPKEGKDRATYLNEKFGGPDRAEAAYERVRQAGREEGIAFAFEKIDVSPNTLDAHRLILWSRSDDLQDDVVERLFRAYFVEGRNLAKSETLVQISAEAGMQSDLVEQLFETDSDLAKLKRQIDQASEMGVTGVPFFIIDGRFALAGAEDPATIAAALQHAEATRSDEDAVADA